MATEAEITEILGYLNNNETIPDLGATHNCNVEGCHQLPNGRGWSCPKPAPDKCITGRNKFVKVTVVIEALKRKIAEKQAELNALTLSASTELQSASARAEADKVAALRIKEEESNSALRAAQERHEAALNAEKALKAEQERLVAEKERIIQQERGQRANKNAANAANAARSKAAIDEQIRNLETQIDEATQDAETSLRLVNETEVRARDLDNRLARATADLAETQPNAAKFILVSRAYNRLKALQIKHLDILLHQLDNKITGKGIFYDSASIQAQKDLITAQRAAISQIEESGSITPENIESIMDRINSLETELIRQQNLENTDYERAERAVGGKHKTYRHKAAKRKQTKRRKLQKKRK